MTKSSSGRASIKRAAEITSFNVGSRRSSLAGMVIKNVHAIGTTAEIGVVIMRPHGHPAAAHAARGFAQGIFNQIFRNSNPDTIDPGSAPGQDLTRPVIMDVPPTRSSTSSVAR